MISYDDHLKKVYCLDYDYTIDILDNVISDMKKYLQNESNSPEAGGVLIGYKVKGKRQVVIEDLSIPDSTDTRRRFGFIRKATSHVLKIKKSHENSSFCIGNWHTHPMDIPHPSSIDIGTWQLELNSCKSSFHYQVYIICGKKGFEVWVGSERTKQISTTKENVIENGIYKGVN